MVLTIKISIFAPFLVVVVCLNSLVSGRSEPKFPCFFIFGDSLVDNGNNNELVTEAKVNYLPYGIDFPQGPTGRFTNGRNIADILAELLGFDTYIPPFATAEGEEIIRGVNYGSGGSGILNESGQQLGDRISLERQLTNHKQSISSISQLLGTNYNDTTSNNNSAKQHLNKCLYYVWMGSNDYINNYYMPEYYTTSETYTPEQYADLLIQQYSQHLRKLYDYGARKVAISALGPIGCTPAELARNPNEHFCVSSVNNAIQLFNNKLELLICDLNNNFPDAKFIYLPSLIPTVINGLISPGISEPCCKVLSNGQCIPGEPPCLARALHPFFDNFHPSELVNKAMAAAAYVKIHTLI